MKIKLVTVNVWDGGRLLDNIVAFIKKEDPDIVVLQEAYDGKNPNLEKRFRTIEIFQKEFGFLDFLFAPAFLDIQSTGGVEQGNAVLSRFPIVNQEVIFFDKPYGRFDSQSPKHFGLLPAILQHVIISVSNAKLNIFNIHGIWGIDGKDNERRLKMSKIIVDKIKDKQNVILAGDFNVQPNTKTIQDIEKYLKNVFKDELQTTFNTKRKEVVGGYSTAVVDMIFVSKNIKVLYGHCLAVDVSDHFPLVCILEL